ncbi:MAG: mltB [Gammaproteobacteria bacterium]|jgi:membrane-bound lytic murein transglycosylase B|nr:mltB [Gammaproteobacteria bacterium]
MFKKFSLTFITCAALHTAWAANNLPSPSEQQDFIRHVAPRYGLSAAEVQNALDKANFQPSIIKAITKPAEGKSYGDYRKLLLTPKRIEAGKDFIKSYTFAFNKEKKLFDIPSEIVGAIIGVETSYGKNTGKFRLLDSLATLSFGYPKREDFFQKELAQYLAISKNNNWNVTKLTGSYAGAFGWPQFMPSSYVRYAVSAYPGAKPDLYNPNDAILSVGNYFEKSGWVSGGPVAVPVTISPNTCTGKLECNKRQPLYPVSVWRAHGVSVPANIPDNLKASVVTLKTANDTETWMTFQNFFVITCYNISINYAMAVFELSQAIKS